MLQICTIFTTIRSETQSCLSSLRNNSTDKLGYTTPSIPALGLSSYGINNFLGMCYMKDDFTKVETIYYKAILVQPILEIPNPGIMISSFTYRKFYLPLDMCLVFLTDCWEKIWNICTVWLYWFYTTRLHGPCIMNVVFIQVEWNKRRRWRFLKIWHFAVFELINEIMGEFSP